MKGTSAQEKMDDRRLKTATRITELESMLVVDDDPAAVREDVAWLARNLTLGAWERMMRCAHRAVQQGARTKGGFSDVDVRGAVYAELIERGVDPSDAFRAARSRAERAKTEAW